MNTERRTDASSTYMRDNRQGNSDGITCTWIALVSLRVAHVPSAAKLRAELVDEPTAKHCRSIAAILHAERRRRQRAPDDDGQQNYRHAREDLEMERDVLRQQKRGVIQAHPLYSLRGASVATGSSM